MTAQQPERMRFTHFTSFAPAGPPGAMWNHPKARNFDYMNLDHWTKLAQALEKAKFDGIFWADHSSVHDVYQGAYTTAVREAMQFPLGDPLTLTAALAASTKDLGFAFSANIIQDHPYAFARRLSTLDHLSRGRIAWNIVTSFQPSAWRNLGHDNVDEHSARYERAEEYVTVLYKLLEGSWEDGAVVRDLERRVFADPEKIHPINHEGKYYRVPGIHTNEPSVQRVPFLFQAGTSGDGRAFSARNAEGMFIAESTPQGAKSIVQDMQNRLAQEGRSASDILFFAQQNVIVGSTEEEVRRKSEEADEYLSSEANLAFMSSAIGTDLSAVDLDTPVGDFQTNALQGLIKVIADSLPDKSLTFRDVAMSVTGDRRLAGTPEQIADKIAEWQSVGVNGINVGSVTGPDDTYAFLEQVVPVLQERGIMQKEYAPGTMREKLFSGTEAASGPRPNDRHPSVRYRAIPALKG